MTANPLCESPAMYQTTDLNLASFLSCRDFRITGIQSHDNRTIFVFDDSAGLQEAILDFANDGMVQVRSFCNTLRDLKALTHSGQRPGGRRHTLVTDR